MNRTAANTRLDSSAVEGLTLADLRELYMVNRTRLLELEAQATLTDEESLEFDTLDADSELYFMAWVGVRTREILAEDLTPQELAARIQQVKAQIKALFLTDDRAGRIELYVEDYALTNVRDRLRFPHKY